MSSVRDSEPRCFPVPMNEPTINLLLTARKEYYDLETI